MNDCKFDPEIETASGLVKCPSCGHFVILGLPHPDFNSANLIVAEAELIKQAEASATSLEDQPSFI